MVRAHVHSLSQQHETFAPFDDAAPCVRQGVTSPWLTCPQILTGPLKVGSDWRLTSLLLSSYFIPTVSLLCLQSGTLLEAPLITCLLYCLLVWFVLVTEVVFAAFHCVFIYLASPSPYDFLWHPCFLPINWHFFYVKLCSWFKDSVLNITKMLFYILSCARK